MAAKRSLRLRQGILDIAPYVPGEERACRQGAGDQALLERDAVRAVAACRRGLSRRRREPVALPRRLGRGTPRGDRQAAWARPGPHRLRGRFRRAAQPACRGLSLAPATRRSIAEHGFLVYRIAILAHGATPVVAKETAHTADVDAILAARHAANARGVSRQSQQPDRHLSRLRRGEAAARSACRTMCCSCSTRPTPNMCAPTTTRPGSELVSATRQHGDDPDLLQDLRAGRAPHRLGLLPAGGCRRAEPHQRSVQCLGSRPLPPVSPRSPTTRMWLAPPTTTRFGAVAWPRR